MSGHTPGPWLLGSISKDRDMAAHYRPISAGGLAIGRVWLQTVYIDESEANAHLIAAAPELLAALRDIVNTIDGVQSSPDWLMDMRDKARAALAKVGL